MAVGNRKVILVKIFFMEPKEHQMFTRPNNYKYHLKDRILGNAPRT